MTTYQPTLESLKQHPVPEWFHDAKFGIMVQWSVSSVPGWANPAGSLHEVTKKFGYEYWFKNNPYAEWYWNTLKIADSPTRAYHVKTYGENFTYPDFKEMFNTAAAKWTPEPWVDLFARIGAKYVVLITKHHDGFTLWQSAHPNPYRSDFHADRDLVGELTYAVRARGLRMGLYYSGGPDWWFKSEPVTDLVGVANTIPQTEEYARYVGAQWRELIERYKPSVLWNDIGFPAKLDVKSLYAEYYNSVPDGVINDRALQADVSKLVKSRLGRAFLRWLLKRVLESPVTGGKPKNFHADFTTPEYTSFSKLTDYKWEATRGLGYSFGYNQNETAEHMLTVEQLIRHLVDIVSKNGNLMLSVPVRRDGTIDEDEVKTVSGVGAWLKVNGEAIYATRAVKGDYKQGDNIYFTRSKDEKIVYAIHVGWPLEKVELANVQAKKGSTVKMLGVDEALPWENAGGKLVIKVPPALNKKIPCEHAFSFKIERA